MYSAKAVRSSKPGRLFSLRRKGSDMVSRAYIVNSALRAVTRRNNAVALAFLRALGVPVGVPVGSPDGEPEWRDPEVMECFSNHGSPMDGRF